jgi:hypothetical protein
MGLLIYAGNEAQEIDDRALAHLMVVIVAKLRRKECFLLNWPDTEGGTFSLWISPAIALEFRFTGSRPAELNRQWLEALERSSTGVRGMLLLREEEASGYLRAAGPSVAP